METLSNMQEADEPPQGVSPLCKEQAILDNAQSKLSRSSQSIELKQQKHFTPLKPQESCLVLGNGYKVSTKHSDMNLIVDALVNDEKCGFAIQYFDGPDFRKIKLSPGAQQILDDPNAGGNSEKSEAMSFELMHRCFGAKLCKTEMNIEYEWSISKRTDYSCLVFGKKIGVSVTRAINFKGGRAVPFTNEDARALLEKKLKGVNLSSRDVVETDAWTKQMLHIWTLEPEAAQVIREEWERLDPELKGNTMVLVTVAPEARWIMFNH